MGIPRGRSDSHQVENALVGGFRLAGRHPAMHELPAFYPRPQPMWSWRSDRTSPRSLTSFTTTVPRPASAEPIVALGAARSAEPPRRRLSGHSKDDHLPDLKQQFSTGNRTRATPCHESREDLRSTTRTDPGSVSLAERHQFLQEGKTVNTAHDFDWVIAMVMRRVVVREPKCLPDSAPRSPEGPLQANGPAGHPPRQQAPRPLELALSRT